MKQISGPEINPYLGRRSTDLTDNGKCSRCGGCCSSLLPVTGAELAMMRRYAEANGIRPAKLPVEPGKSTVYLQCPFLVQRVPERAKSCAIYDARPAVCRAYKCDLTTEQTAREYLDITGTDSAPRPVNVWQIFDRTGLAIDDEEIPYRDAPRARIAEASGKAYQFWLGRPVSLQLVSGRIMPDSLVTGLYKDGLELVDRLDESGAPKIKFVPFSSMAAVLSEENVVQALPDDEPSRPQPNKKGDG